MCYLIEGNMIKGCNITKVANTAKRLWASLTRTPFALAPPRSPSRTVLRLFFQTRETYVFFIRFMCFLGLIVVCLKKPVFMFVYVFV